MDPANKNDDTSQTPDWMRADKTDNSPVHFLDIRGLGLDLGDADIRKRINGKLQELIEEAAPARIEAPALIKTHVGEPSAWQRIIPELVRSNIDFLRSRGVDRIAIGDTTVLYSRGRGRKYNPPDNVDAYINIARDHGWLELGVPFVVLDRSISSAPGVLEFSENNIDIQTRPPNMFPLVRVGGAVEKAGSIFNHVHFTGHALTGLALSVKGIAMGFADERGKTMMHMAFGPVFDPDICDRCGICATECPEDALDNPGEDVPKLDEEKCIGCGQCLSDCPSGAIEMKTRRIQKWDRGADTIHSRLADFFVGIMQSRWDITLHVAHMVKITSQCDCLDIKQQETMCPDIGFLVGKNPFAVDRAAQTLLEETAGDNHTVKNMISLQNKGDMYTYVEQKHGLTTRPKILKSNL